MTIEIAFVVGILVGMVMTLLAMGDEDLNRKRRR